MRYLLIPFIILSLFACDKIDSLFDKRKDSLFENESKNELVQKTYYPNGNLMTLINLDSNKRYHGEVKKFFEDGKLKTLINYKHGVRQEAKQYYENGQLSMYFPYKEGKKHGKRLKYWENGQLHSEMTYYEGEPQKGLIEYRKSGKKVTKYPRLIVKQIDKLEIDGTYQLEAYFSTNPHRGTYYKGNLVNQTIPNNAVKFQKDGRHGVYTYSPAPGQFLMEKVNVIGKYRTPYNNIYITEESVNVAIDY